MIEDQLIGHSRAMVVQSVLKASHCSALKRALTSAPSRKATSSGTCSKVVRSRVVAMLPSTFTVSRSARIAAL